MSNSDGPASRTRLREKMAQGIIPMVGSLSTSPKDYSTTKGEGHGGFQHGLEEDEADGEEDRETKCAIFVHAGAGYHSVQNESLHLMACKDACESGMALLRNGMTAVDAAEMSIKVLEDREITNAGYGSNLTMDGLVECDACIVDHSGRSGAVGAIAQVKNPIHAARKVLEHSKKPLPLKRVPPTLLVGQGATDFAYDQGIFILPHDALVSPSARARWEKWKYDLRTAEKKQRKRMSVSESASEAPARDMGWADSAHGDISTSGHGRHVSDSPLTTTSKSSSWTDVPISRNQQTSLSPREFSPPRATVALGYSSRPRDHASQTSDSAIAMHEASSNALMNSSQSLPFLSEVELPEKSKRSQGLLTSDTDLSPPNPSPLAQFESSHPAGYQRGPPSTRSRRRRRQHDGSSDGDLSLTSTSQSDSTVMTLDRAESTDDLLHNVDHPVAGSLDFISPSMGRDGRHSASTPMICNDHGKSTRSSGDEDMIIDTVGAIAIDRHGNIACAASSGGIGMKFRGRIGPAALLGVGTAIIPIDPTDEDGTCIATVTSGTGEHIGSTLAASVAADRLYSGMKKSDRGLYLERVEDYEVLPLFIKNEFMAHPSVRNSTSAGAIGIMSVRKTKEDIELFYAHNTESFALAYMSEDLPTPACTMSRTSGNGRTAHGGKHIPIRRRR